MLAWIEILFAPFLSASPHRPFLMWASAFELILMALALADRMVAELNDFRYV